MSSLCVDRTNIFYYILVNDLYLKDGNCISTEAHPRNIGAQKKIVVAFTLFSTNKTVIINIKLYALNVIEVYTRDGFKLCKFLLKLNVQ